MKKDIKNKTELLKRFIRNEIKNNLNTQRMRLNEYINVSSEIEGETVDIIIGTAEGKVGIGIRQKNDLNPIQYAILSKSDALHMISALQKLI